MTQPEQERRRRGDEDEIDKSSTVLKYTSRFSYNLF